MRILFLCNTVYQIIVASCIRKMYLDYEADIILSDHSVGNEKIYHSFNEKKLIFDKTFYVKSKFLYETNKSLSTWKKIKSLKNVDLSDLINIGYDYDLFFCANAEPFSERVVNYIKQKNKNIKICWFEDGLSAYEYDQCYFHRGIKGKIKQLVKKIMKVYDVADSVEEYNVFFPQNMEWTPAAKIREIRPIDKELANDLGVIFNVEECVDKYEEKYIFFEDGYSDWNKREDITFIQKMADIVGKENIIVKIHPRNPDNRFVELGFKTNKDLSIPWEIIAMNMDITEKVFVTMYSQSILTPRILLKKKYKAIMLCKMVKGFDDSNHKMFDYYYKHFLSKDKRMYRIPENMEQFVNIVREIEQI